MGEGGVWGDDEISAHSVNQKRDAHREEHWQLRPTYGPSLASTVSAVWQTAGAPWSAQLTAPLTASCHIYNGTRCPRLNERFLSKRDITASKIRIAACKVEIKLNQGQWRVCRESRAGAPSADGDHAEQAACPVPGSSRAGALPGGAPLGGAPTKLRGENKPFHLCLWINFRKS